MNIKIFEFNPVRENTYILYDETKECVIIDAGCFYPEEESQLLSFISENKLNVKHLLNTHLHFDHVLGITFIENEFHLKAEANKDDEFLLESLPMQMEMFGFKPIKEIPVIGKYLYEDDIVKFGNLGLAVLAVPGHSPGSIAFYSEKNRAVFVGDALFKSSIGRTDLPKGNHSQLLQAIQEKLFTLPLETIVYPGHGPATSIGEEIRFNPFFQ